ncbi:MAG: glycosyltransferase [Canibacter sp.]
MFKNRAALRAKTLPEAPTFVLTDSVPEPFGGVTTAVLAHCNALAGLGHRDVTMLTFSNQLAFTAEEVRQRLVTAGRLHLSVHFRNTWFDLRTLPDAILATLESPKTEFVEVQRTAFDGRFIITRSNEAGDVLQVDRFREDGTLAVSDRRDMRIPGQFGGRLITVFSRGGAIIKQWTALDDLRRSWLAYLMNRRELNILLAERLTSSNVLADWKPSNVVFVQCIHSNHFLPGVKEKYGAPSPKAAFYRSLDFRDLVVTLTDKQATDLREAELVAVDNMVTIPNGLVLDPLKRPTPRDRGSGVVVARLSPEKQIQHGIRVMDRLRHLPLTLDVYGEGKSREPLEALTAELELESVIVFRGYANGAEKFREHSFSLLTSSAEGQPITLLESMAAGCIPIAYDIDYGPSDIIEHGVNGFLVKPDDAERLEYQITQFLGMNERAVLRMRKAAIIRSRDFHPDRVASQWAKALNGAVEAHSRKDALPKGNARLMELGLRGDSVHLWICITGKAANVKWSWAKLVWLQRRTSIYGRTPARIRRMGSRLIIEAQLPLDRLEHSREFLNQVLEIWVDLGDSNRTLRLRLRDAVEPSNLQLPGYRLRPTPYGNVSVDIIAN